MSRLAAQPLQVLIVDDAPTDRIVFRRHLTRGTDVPCAVAEVSSGAKALDHLREHQVDCVLLDFDLPDCDGLTLVRNIVAAHGAHAFGIVMLTSATNIELAVEALQCGAHDFLQKNSAGAISLRRAVENAIEKAAIQRELEAQRRALAEKNQELQIHVARLEKEAAERHRAQMLVRESEQQLRLVTDHAAVLLAHYDERCRCKFVNRPYAERFGRTPGQIIGKHISEIFGEEAFQSILGHIQAVLAGQQVDFEFEIPFASLGPRWMHVVYAPERLLDGRVIGFVGVMTDITQRKRSEHELETARDEALAASRAKDDFLAALSHELRTPLNPVLLLASEAAEDASIPEDTRTIFETIRKNVDLEARLIDDLLNITRISRGKLALDRHTVDVHAVLMDAITNVSVELDQKHLSLRLHLNAPWHTVMGDAVRLQQVFWNILKNAVKFTSEGGSVTVTTNSLPEADELEIVISDTGIGMTTEELIRVFDAFAQGEHAGEGGSHRFGGLGLGLAISRMLVESHSGRIDATSVGRGQGSTFTVFLPLAPQIPEQLPIRAPEHEPAHNHSPVVAASSTHILLVEDHEPTRTALTQLLTRRRYRVISVGSASEALAAAADQKFDLLISDIGLPDGNGNDLMSALAQSHPLKGIALTGYGMERDIARTQEAGFFTHLTKPIRMEQLQRAIEETLAS